MNFNESTFKVNDIKFVHMLAFLDYIIFELYKNNQRFSNKSLLL